MGSAINSKDYRHDESFTTTRGVCECKASILQAYFKGPTALVIKVFFIWNLSLSEQENFSTLNMSL